MADSRASIQSKYLTLASALPIVCLDRWLRSVRIGRRVKLLIEVVFQLHPHGHRLSIFHSRFERDLFGGINSGLG